MIKMITILDPKKEKICPSCHVKMEAEIFSDPKINPRETGNPWKCQNCKEIYGCKDGTTYYDHVLLVRDRVVNKFKEMKQGDELDKKKNCSRA